MSGEVHHIAEWRRMKHATLQQFASLLDVSISALYAWERGERVPRQRMRQRIAERLGVTYDQVAYGKPDAKKEAA